MRWLQQAHFAQNHYSAASNLQDCRAAPGLKHAAIGLQCCGRGCAGTESLEEGNPTSMVPVCACDLPRATCEKCKEGYSEVVMQGKAPKFLARPGLISFLMSIEAEHSWWLSKERQDWTPWGVKSSQCPEIAY